MKKSLQLLVRGQVQGVGFRAHTKQVADVLGVVGFVKNLPNGSVQVQATGEETMIYKLVDYCHHGPPNATVTKVSVEFGSSEVFDGFSICE